MFLDDELEAIYQEKGFCEQTSVELIKACLRRVPKYEGYNAEAFINAIKRMDGGWRLFCKKHPEFRADGIRDYYCKALHLSEQTLSLFGWDK